MPTVTRGTAVVIAHFPKFIAVAADTGARRRLQGSPAEEFAKTCKIAAVKNRFLISFTTMDIQNDVKDPNDHLLKRAIGVVLAASTEEPLEAIVWRIAQNEMQVMAAWNAQEPSFFPMQADSERGPAITVAYMGQDGHSQVLLTTLTMEEKHPGEFVPSFAIRSLRQDEIAFGAKAAAVREEILANRTMRAHAAQKRLNSLTAANTPRKLRRSIQSFIRVAKRWYPEDVFGRTDLAVLTPSGVNISGMGSNCR